MSLDVGLLAKGLEADQRADRIDAWRKWGRGKIRRVRTPEGARFYGAPIGTPIVADPKTGKLKAVRALPAPGTYTFRDVPTQDGPTTIAITTYARGGGQMHWESPKRKFTHPYPEGEDEALVRMWRQLSEAASPEAEVVQPTPRTLLDTPITTVHKFTYDEPLWHVSLTGKPPGSNGWIHMGDKDAAKSRLRQTQRVFDDFAGEEKYEKVLRHVLLHDEQFEPQWFRPQILTQPLNGPGSLVSDEFANLVTSGRTKRVSPAEAREYGWDGNPLDVGHDEFSGEEFVAVQMGLDEWAARVEQFVSHAERTAQAWQDTDIARAQRRVWEQIQANGFRVDPLYYENRGEHTQAPSVVAAASDVAWDLYPTEDPLTFSKIRRVRTPEGAKFYNAPIGTPIVADKATGKLRALTTAKLPQAPLLKDWKPGDPTDRIKAQITDVVRGVLDEAGLPEGTLTVSVKPASTLSKLTVAVRYSRPDDYKKASVALHRQIYPSERKVHNWQFSVAKDLQGHGIGAKMTAALEDLWRSEGIETVTVGANADVGGYAWARLGFEFKDPAQAAEFVSDAQKQITKYAPIWAKKVSPEYVEDVKAQVQALQERLDAGDTILPAEIAMLGYREGLDDPPFYWLGKRVLLGTSWDGVKDISQPVVMQQRTRKKATNPGAPEGGEWIFEDGSAVEFVAPHEELVAGGLRSWVGSPADMHIHMADEIAGAPQPSSGGGKIMRAEAKALLEELARNGKPTPKLYRGATNTSLDEIPQSWSENRATARRFAKLSGGTVDTLQPGEAVGIRMADYITSGLDEFEQQWLVVAPKVLAQRTKRNAQTAPDDAFEGFSPEDQAGLQALAKVRPVELTPEQRALRRRWKDLGLDEWDIPVRSHGRWTAQPDGSRVNEFGDTLRIDADLSPQEQYQIQQSFDRALATLPKVYFDAESDQPTQVGLYVPKAGKDPMFDDNFSDAYVMRGTPLITLSPTEAKSSGMGMRLDRTVLHEMGHVVDGRLGHTDGMDVLGNPMGEAQGDGGLFISLYPQFANRYAGSDPHEGYAEMYREFFSGWINPYSGPSQASKKYARKYKWAGRPRKKGQKVLAQRTKRNAPPKGSGAEILSKVVLPEGVDGVNVVYKGPDMSDWPDEKIVPIDVDTYMDPDGGDIPTPWDYEIRGSTRRVNPLEPHDHRDVIWHGSKASWDTDYGDSVVDTSPDNPDSKGLDEAIQLWVVGKKYGDFPYVGEMRLAAAEQMGLDSPHTVEEELDNNRPMREHGTLAASTIRNNAKNLLAAIRRAEPAQPDLFRGVDSQQRDGFAGIKEGDTLTLPPSSFSRDPTVAESYATKWYPGVGHERVGEQQLIFHVVPGARGVKDTVHLPADQEVITGGKFVVRGVHTYTTEKWDMNEVGTGELYENPIFDDEGQQIGFEPPKHKPYARYFKTPITYTVVDIEQVSV